MQRFRDRRDAGRHLAGSFIETYGHRSDVVVLALPRGGVPVAYEIASALRAPLDVLVVRHLAVPGGEGKSLGAIVSGGAQVLDRETLTGMRVTGVSLQRVIAQETAELARHEHAYRGNAPLIDIRGKHVIVVDDGLSGARTLLSACNALRARLPASIAVAIPAATVETCARLRSVADEVVCLLTSPQLSAVASCYKDFAQTSDDEVREMLRHVSTPSSIAAA